MGNVVEITQDKFLLTLPSPRGEGEAKAGSDSEGSLTANLLICANPEGAETTYHGLQDGVEG